MNRYEINCELIYRFKVRRSTVEGWHDKKAYAILKRKTSEEWKEKMRQRKQLKLNL